MLFTKQSLCIRGMSACRGAVHYIMHTVCGRLCCCCNCAELTLSVHSLAHSCALAGSYQTIHDRVISLLSWAFLTKAYENVDSVLDDMLQISQYGLVLKAYKHGYFLDQEHAWEAETLHHVLVDALGLLHEAQLKDGPVSRNLCPTGCIQVRLATSACVPGKAQAC